MRSCSRSVHLICSVGIGPAVEQQAHHLEVAVLGGKGEARDAVLHKERGKTGGERQAGIMIAGRYNGSIG